MSWGGEEERKGRPIITDQQGVRSTGDPSKLVVVDSDAEVVDLLGEGSIEGLVSGTYRFEGNKGYTGDRSGAQEPAPPAMDHGKGVVVGV